MQIIYFDQAATVPVRPEVLAEFVRISCECAGNPSSLHALGLTAAKTIAVAKESLARTLGCRAEELIFTSGATESINTALRGYHNSRYRESNEIIYSGGDHAATLQTVKYLENAGRIGIDIGLTATGHPDLARLEAALSPQTFIITLLAVNNETGAITDLSAVARLRNLRAPQAAIHIDYTQAPGKKEIDLRDGHCDLASFSGHKVGALKGSGLLYCRDSINLQPLIFGGGQQGNMRSGTESPAMAAQLALAMNLAIEEREETYERVTALRALLLEELSGTEFILNSYQPAVPHIVNIAFPGILGQTLASALSGEGFMVATTSACGARSPVSHVLSAMGRDKTEAQSAIRISLAANHTEAEVRTLAAAIRKNVGLLRAIGGKK
ncbi:MAG: cysteine desulfurase [Clostridiaceae bacterium]|nr:cysteine desulfurase [Clostridiaceae bacterium]